MPGACIVSARDDYPVLNNHALGLLQFVSIDDAREINRALDEIDRLHTETDGLRNMLNIVDDLRADYDADNNRLQRRESQLEAQVETLEIVISRLREVCDAAYTLVREYDDELVDLQWCVLLCALDDARYEPRP